MKEETYMNKKVNRKAWKKKEVWEKNLTILWLGTFMAGIAFSLVAPFMSLYIDTLGHFNTRQLNFWSGIAFSSTFFVTALISPFWGKLADQKGRKIMLMRASLGMAFAIGAMGGVTNVYQLVFLRFLTGIFSGYMSNASALIATCTPAEKSGKVLGILATGSVSGNLLGPLFGGVFANWFGYRRSFFITGCLLFIVFCLSTFFVHETFQPIKKSEMVKGKAIFRELHYPHFILGMFVTTLIIQASNTSITPIISLYVRQLLHDHGNITLLSGIAASIPGLATLLSASKLGEWGDKIGSERILLFGLFFSVFIFIPMSFVHSIWQFLFLRFLVGISDACLLPAVQSLLTKYTPKKLAGRMFSYNQSFQAAGNVLGPMIGSSISSTFGYSGVFMSTALCVFCNIIWIKQSTKDLFSSH